MSKLTPIQEKFGAHVKEGTKFVSLVEHRSIRRGDIIELYMSLGATMPSFWNASKTDYHWLALDQVELLQPFKAGDVVEVSDIGKSWVEEPHTFVADSRDISDAEIEFPFICLDENSDVSAWKHIRHPKPDTSITFADGTKVELSEESYNKLRGE